MFGIGQDEGPGGGRGKGESYACILTGWFTGHGRCMSCIVTQVTEASMQVFDNDDFPPDAEFGCFQMVNGPQDTDFAEEALLRLDVGEASCTSICCHVHTHIQACHVEVS